MNPDCDICAGSGKIRLPVLSRAVVSMRRIAATAPMEVGREYPCPECGEYVPIQRLWVRESLGSCT